MCATVPFLIFYCEFYTMHLGNFYKLLWRWIQYWFHSPVSNKHTNAQDSPEEARPGPPSPSPSPAASSPCGSPPPCTASPCPHSRCWEAPMPSPRTPRSAKPGSTCSVRSSEGRGEASRCSTRIEWESAWVPTLHSRAAGVRRSASDQRGPG